MSIQSIKIDGARTSVKYGAMQSQALLHTTSPFWQILTAFWRGLGASTPHLPAVQLNRADSSDLPSIFPVSDLAAAAVAAAGCALSELMAARLTGPHPVTVDKRQASLWFAWSIRPDGWKMPAPWDPIAGDYATADGWIRLHTNAPHHRAAALTVLGTAAEKDEVARAVSLWTADALETAIVEKGGCAAAMRSIAQWEEHSQGSAVGAEPLVFLASLFSPSLPASSWTPSPARPLRGLRVLDLTRVLAGPVATRFLAGFGAEVLRIDPPTWDEPGVIPEVTLGKRCARLDLRERAGRELLWQLLESADVLVHGYRADALERLGFGPHERQAIRPGLIDVSLNAFGWSGPWRNRRGFDSLVQMSSGIADAGMCRLHKDRPTPLPVQALDHATGYLMAAAVIRGLTHRTQTGHGTLARTSLARMAQVLIDHGEPREPSNSFVPAADSEYADATEQTDFGPAHRLLPPLQVGAAAMQWDRPASVLGSAQPSWL